MGIEFEYTTTGSLQQNYYAEQKFATLFNRVCALINGEKISPFLRNSSWAKTTNAASFFDNKLLTPLHDLSSFQQFFGKGKRSISTLVQKFGAMCIATHQDNSHSVSIYCVLNTKMKKMHNKGCDFPREFIWRVEQV